MSLEPAPSVVEEAQQGRGRLLGETPAFFPDWYAAEHPDKPAYVMAGSGETVSYRQLV